MGLGFVTFIQNTKKFLINTTSYILNTISYITPLCFFLLPKEMVICPFTWYLTIDNLNTSFEFIQRIYTPKDTQVNKKYLYTVNTLERYTIYIFLTLAYWIFIGIFWNTFSKYLLWISAYFVLPVNINRIHNSKIVGKFKKKIVKFSYRLFEYCILNLTAYLLNSICKVSLSYDPMVTSSELQKFTTKENLVYLVDFVKLFSIRIGIQYLKYVNVIGLTIAERVFTFYSWKNNNLLHQTFTDPLPQIQEPKEKIRILISNRMWNLFYNHHIIKILIHMYQDDNESKLIQKIKKYHSNISLQFGKLCTIYTLISIINYRSFNGILSILLTLVFARQPSFSSIKWMLLCLPFTTNLIVYLFLSECSTFFKIPVINWCSSQILQYCQKKLSKIFVFNLYTGKLIFTTIMFWNLSRLIDPNLICFAICLTVLPLPQFVILLSILGKFSSYSLLHLIYLSLVYYCVRRIIKLKFNVKPIFYTHIVDYIPKQTNSNNFNYEMEEYNFQKIMDFDENFFTIK